MNKLLRDLFEKAGGVTHYGNYEFDWFDPELFAKLIMAECASACSHPSCGRDQTAEDLIAQQFTAHERANPECSICGTTENVAYMGGHQPYLCDSTDCIPF
jgi:hypothetical protein